MGKYFAESELIINADGSVFHLHVKPGQLADKVILVGDPGRVALVASHFQQVECDVRSREFHTVTGTYNGKRVSVVSTGIGCDNIDIVVNELVAFPDHCACRNLWGAAARYAYRYLYSLGEKHWF